MTVVESESEDREFQKNLSGRNGTDSMPLTFEYIKTNSTAPEVIEFVICGKIIRKSNQLITIEKFKKKKKNIVVVNHSIVYKWCFHTTAC